MKSDVLLLPLLLLAWLALSARAQSATSLTIVVRNLPGGGLTANGQSVACVGTLNGWNNSATTAVVAGGRLEFVFADVGALAALDSAWGDLPPGANAAFQFVAPGTWNSAVCADFISNQGNFRVALAEGIANVVEIDAGPAPWLVDQASAVRVNGAAERESPAIDLSRFAFPGGKWKALVMSYDDGHVQDRGLVSIFNAHGIKGSFHLNSKSLDSDTFVTKAELAALYAGHEISSHTVDHPYLDTCPESSIRWEIETDRAALEPLAGHQIRSLSYPFGAYNDLVLSTLRRLGVNSARTTKHAWNPNYLPADPLKWHPTCPHSGAMTFAQPFADRTEERMALLYVWGHSYELDYGHADNSWDYMSALCAILGDRGDVWYAGVTEVADYVAAIRGLEWPFPNCVYNPSGLSIWAKLDGTLCRIQPGKRMTWPAGAVSAAPECPPAGGVATIRYAPGTNAFAGAAAVTAHLGHDGWQDVADLAMAPNGDGSWSVAVSVPAGAERIDFAFTDGAGLWDDNGGQDWSLAVRAAEPAVPAAIQAALASPTVATKPDSSQNSAGDAFDLRVGGGALATTFQGGFGDFGQTYVDVDDDCLYLGATNCSLGGTNHALILFLSVDTMPGGVENLWNLRGAPFGLDRLHNLALAPAAHVAVVVGDEYGDGSFPHFNLESGADFGQGVFYLCRSNAFQSVPGARLSQFDGAGPAATAGADDDGNRQTDRWEAAIPWRSLNAAAGWRSVRALHVSGVIASDGVSGSDRYLSGNVLGAMAAGTLAGGNYGFNFVSLAGWRVGLPFEDSDLDGHSDLQESLAGTDAADAASQLEMTGSDAAGLRFAAVPGRRYRLQYKLDLSANAPWTDLPATWCPTNASCAATGLVDGAASAFYRVRLDNP